MGKGQKFVRHMADRSVLSNGGLLHLPIVEISGDKRVLIENHLGVQEYGSCNITVKMPYGKLRIQGEHLEILHMTRDQLIIRGKICGIALLRGKES